MNEILKRIEELSASLLTDANLQLTRGNKAAGARARKVSLELERLLKDFRKASLEEVKSREA